MLDRGMRAFDVPLVTRVAIGSLRLHSPFYAVKSRDIDFGCIDRWKWSEPE